MKRNTYYYVTKKDFTIVQDDAIGSLLLECFPVLYLKQGIYDDLEKYVNQLFTLVLKKDEQLFMVLYLNGNSMKFISEYFGKSTYETKIIKERILNKLKMCLSDWKGSDLLITTKQLTPSDIRRIRSKLD